MLTRKKSTNPSAPVPPTPQLAYQVLKDGTVLPVHLIERNGKLLVLGNGARVNLGVDFFYEQEQAALAGIDRIENYVAERIVYLESLRGMLRHEDDRPRFNLRERIISPDGVEYLVLGVVDWPDEKDGYHRDYVVQRKGTSDSKYMAADEIDETFISYADFLEAEADEDQPTVS